MRGFRYFMPLVLAFAMIWWACDGRSVSTGTGLTNQVIGDLSVSFETNEIEYTQSNVQSKTDSVFVRVLDANGTTIPDVAVTVRYVASFPVVLDPVGNGITDEQGVALFIFAVRPDAEVTGDQTVTIIAEAGSKSGQADLQLLESSAIQLSWVDPESANVVFYRIVDTSLAPDVTVFASQVADGGETIGATGETITFSVTAIGEGLPGEITTSATTGDNGLTSGVKYFNSHNQPDLEDGESMQIKLKASLDGADTSIERIITFVNSLGYNLSLVQPALAGIQNSLVCDEYITFIYRLTDPYGNPVSGFRFDLLAPSTGEFSGSIDYTSVTDENGMIEFNWRNCDAADTDLQFVINGEENLSYTFDYSIAEASPFTLTKVLPNEVDLSADIICNTYTHFAYRLQEENGTLVAGMPLGITLNMGEMMEVEQYNPTTSDLGVIEFDWKLCDSEGGALSIQFETGSGMSFTKSYTVSDARAIQLEILTPISGNTLEIDAECNVDNAIPVQVKLSYADTGAPISEQNINFNVNLPSSIDGTVLTDVAGIALANWHDCNEAHAGQNLELNANFTLDGVTNIHSVNATYPLDLPVSIPDHITLTLEDTELPNAIGSQSTTVTARVYNSQNAPLGANYTIGFRTSGGVGTITTPDVTDENGIATAEFQMNSVTGSTQITAFYEKPNTDPVEELLSSPVTLTVNSGLPSNVTLGTNNARIQIRGFGDSSVSQVTGALVDATGSAVSNVYDIGFTMEIAPEGAFLSSAGIEQQYYFGDTLWTTTTDGIAEISINAGTRPGTVSIATFASGDGFDVYANESLITVVAGPPVHGSLDYDPTGVAIGASLWQVTWSVHLWDMYSNQVEDSLAVYFSVEPNNILAMDGFGQTGFDANDEEGSHGIAQDYMVYHCSTIGDVLTRIYAQVSGVEMEIVGFGDTTWVPTWIYVDYPIENPPGFQVPFQAGDRDDNLSLAASAQNVVFANTGADCNGHQCVDIDVQATLVDGYGCPVADQLIQFNNDVCGPSAFDPDQVLTDETGVAATVLSVCSDCLQQNNACPEDEDCFAFTPFQMGLYARRLPDNNPTATPITISLQRPCQN
jgi:hypothetical protein